MYRIVFVDEQTDDIDAFKDYVEEKNTKEPFEVIAEYPTPELDEMIDLIFSHNPDAIVVDYMLNENKETIKYNVPYNGVELIENILDIREAFPCFVMTSFDDDAINEIEDVNKIYIKGILHKSEAEMNAKASFLERVQSQINHYRGKIDNAEQRLLELLEKRKQGTATIDEEDDIIRLDQFLEKALDKRAAIPEDYKTLSNTKKLDSILTTMNELLKKVNQNNAK